MSKRFVRFRWVEPSHRRKGEPRPIAQSPTEWGLKVKESSAHPRCAGDAGRPAMLHRLMQWPGGDSRERWGGLLPGGADGAGPAGSEISRG